MIRPVDRSSKIFRSVSTDIPLVLLASTIIFVTENLIQTVPQLRLSQCPFKANATHSDQTVFSSVESASPNSCQKRPHYHYGDVILNENMTLVVNSQWIFDQDSDEPSLIST